MPGRVRCGPKGPSLKARRRPPAPKRRPALTLAINHTLSIYAVLVGDAVAEGDDELADAVVQACVGACQRSGEAAPLRSRRAPQEPARGPSRVLLPHQDPTRQPFA